MQLKREAERDPNGQALTPTAKVKPHRQPNPPTQTSKSQFTLTRKKKSTVQLNSGIDDSGTLLLHFNIALIRNQ